MDRAVEAFENDFARWDLHLPADAVATRCAGQIQHAGWSVRFNFGQDAHGDYLDYYASPRDVTEDPPGNDWHVRLYESGERISLPTVLEAYMYGRDPTWEELERARRPFAGQPADSPGDAPPADPAGAEKETAASEPEWPSPDSSPRRPGQAGQHAIRETSEDEAVEAVRPKASADLDPGALEPDAAPSYLPIDIGLDIELNLSALSGPGGSETHDPPSPITHGVAPDDPPDTVDRVDAAELVDAPEPDDGAEAVDATAPLDALEAGDTLEPVDGSEPARIPEPVDEPKPVGLPEPIDTRPREEPAPSERFYATEDPTALLPAKAEDSVLKMLPLLDVYGDPDDRPAPITLGLVHEEPDTQPREHAVVETPPVKPIETVPVAAPDEVTGAAVSEATATNSTVNAEAPSSVPTWESEFPEAAALTGPIRSRPKVFPRADLVLTSDVAAIDGSFDSDSFLPWWHRPGARRIAAAIAAVVVVGLIAVAATHHRSHPSTEQGDPDNTDSTASVTAPAPGSTAADSVGNTDSDTTVQSQSSATPIPSISPADSSQAPAPSTQTQTQPTPTSDGADRGSDEGMARPAGPQSISPIVPSASVRSHPTSAKSPPGSFPHRNSQ